MPGAGRLLILLGVVLIGLGVLLQVADRLPWLGRLPGDIVVKRGPTTVYFPLATSLLLSVIASVLLYFWRR